MDKLPFSKILALSPHPDDIEFGCGAMLRRLAAGGAQVDVMVFSSCDESLPDGYFPGDAIREMKRSVKVLGVKSIYCHMFPVRNFPEHRQSVLDSLYHCDLDPDLVLVPCRQDVHQDH